MDAATISAVAELIEALPQGPYIVVESPLPALEQIAGRDINLGSTFGDINLPFGEDAIDVHTEETDDHSTTVGDINVGNPKVSGADVNIDSAVEPTPEPESGETVADSDVNLTEPETGETGETVADSDVNLTEPETGETGETVADSAVEPAPELPTLDPSEVEPEAPATDA